MAKLPQIIVTGDFFQLPPVTKGSASVKFAFEAEEWAAIIGKNMFNLTQVFRQKDPGKTNALHYFMARVFTVAFQNS